MFLIRQFKKAGLRSGWQKVNNLVDNGLNEDETSNNKEKDDDQKGNVKSHEIDELKKAGDTHLITFAAGFTLHGGYKGDEEPDPGSAILTRKAAFQAFVIADTLAMVLSSSAVFIHLLMAVKEETSRWFWHITEAALLTYFAMGAMVIAFVTGTYAVLAHSSALAVATCVLGCLFFPYYLYLGAAVRECYTCTWKIEIKVPRLLLNR